MGTLVVAEHDNQALRPVTLNVLAAALEIGGEIDLLVAGQDCGAVAAAAAAVPGVGRVLCADNPAYAHHLAENMALLIAELGASYDHILAAHTTTGKNFLPRVAALLDVAMISDIVGVDAPDTFKRPIYAGNGIATVRSDDGKRSSRCAARASTRRRGRAAAPPLRPWPACTTRASPRSWAKNSRSPNAPN